MMKIIIFSDNVAPYRIGWADELAKTNKVVFAYTKAKDSERNNEWLVKESKYSQMVKLPSLIIKNHAFTLNVVRYLRDNSADIIIFDGYGVIPNMLGMIYLKIKKKYYFINVDGVQTGAIESKLKRKVKEFFFRPYAKFLCSSEYVADCIKQYGVKKSNIFVHNFSSVYKNDILESPIPLKEKKIIRSELKLENVFTVVAVGRFLELKQFDMLIKAFIPLDNVAQLLIIGEGPEENVYKSIIRDKKLNHVFIIPFMRYEQLKKYYSSADVFVLSSNNEVWGLVINEAMSFGLPILVSDRCVGGYALVKNGVNGYIFPYNNIGKLSEYLSMLIANEDLRINMGRRSLEIIRNFTIEHMATVHTNIFRKIIEIE